jgi:hypothetical protein
LFPPSSNAHSRRNRSWPCRLDTQRREVAFAISPSQRWLFALQVSLTLVILMVLLQQ